VFYNIEDAPLDEENFKRTQIALAKLFESDASVCDLPRVMRLPGFPHQKNPQKPFITQIAYNISQRAIEGETPIYTEAEFQRALSAALIAHRPRKSLSNDAIAGLPKPPPDWSEGYNEGERNNECARRAGSCLARGMSEDEAFRECLRWDAEYNDPPLGEIEVRKTVASIARTDSRKQATIAGGEKQDSETLSVDLRIVRGDELLSTAAPPRRWIESWVPAAETTMLGGDGGMGKTTLGLQLGVAAVSEGDWLGHKVKPCNVLYVSAEDPKDEIHFRLEQIARHLTLTKEELARFKLIDLAGKDLAITLFEKDGRLKRTLLFGEIESAARDHNAGCIIFDAVADFFGGNENERREVRAFVALLRGLAMRRDAAVVVIAHPSVDAIKTGRGYSGSTHWNNAVRSRLYFTEAEKDVNGAPLHPDLRVIELAKSNRARRGEKIHMIWMDGRFVPHAPGSSVNLKNEAEAEELFLQLLSKVTKQGMHVSPYRSSSYAPTVLAKQPGAKGIGKAPLEGAMHRLFDKGKIRNQAYGPPSKVRHRLVIEPNTSGPGVR
jgi:RecA-family ATPase